MDQPGAVDIQTLEWIESGKVIDRTMVKALQTEIDEGQAERIALSIELG